MGPSYVHATLVNIGTATYNGSDYKLIWDDDNNGNSVIWLDYINPGTGWTWLDQTAWAAGLAPQLSYNLYGKYSISWLSDWRLGSTTDGEYVMGTDGTTTAGYNITSSEMGHLFYDELGNTAVIGPTTPDSTPPIDNGIFDNLVGNWFWSGTEKGDNPEYAWYFAMHSGQQTLRQKDFFGGGLAIRTGEVTVNPVPEPTTALLFSIGATGIGIIRKRKNK